jgi:hypothetical protein
LRFDKVPFHEDAPLLVWISPIYHRSPLIAGKHGDRPEVTDGKISLFAAQKLKKANRVGKIPHPMFIFVNSSGFKRDRSLRMARRRGQ